jgi:hypothetical protein
MPRYYRASDEFFEGLRRLCPAVTQSLSRGATIAGQEDARKDILDLSGRADDELRFAHNFLFWF